MKAFDPVARLREIAAERQRLAEEEAQLLDMLSPVATPSAVSIRALAQNLRPLKVAAGEFGVSQKRMQRWATGAGALRKVAGRLLVDVAILQGKVWPDLTG